MKPRLSPFPPGLVARWDLLAISLGWSERQHQATAHGVQHLFFPLVLLGTPAPFFPYTSSMAPFTDGEPVAFDKPRGLLN